MIINSKILLVANNVKYQRRPSNRVATVMFRGTPYIFRPHCSSNSMKINAIQGEKSVIKSPL